jgi:hypothetical protein
MVEDPGELKMTSLLFSHVVTSMADAVPDVEFYFGANHHTFLK